MDVGYAAVDITPQWPVPLCGFAARCGALSATVADPLAVKALAVTEGHHTLVVLAYDLLALGPEVTADLEAAVAGVGDAHTEFLFCCTHTHSAPAAVRLLGCGDPDPRYLATLGPRTRQAAAAALAARRPARWRWTTASLPAHSYNRRRVLADGRVTMTVPPGATVVRSGPIWDRMLLIRFEELTGQPLAGVVTWAAHPATVCSAAVTADWPGNLCRELATAHGLPMLYLQGACGNVNAPAVQRSTRAEMHEHVRSLMAVLGTIRWPETTAAGGASQLLRHTEDLRYDPLPRVPDLAQLAAAMTELATSPTPSPAALKLICNILNLRSADDLAPVLRRHFGATLAKWAEQTRRTLESGPVAPCPARLAAWRLGPLLLAFIPAEVFVETQVTLQAAFPENVVAVIGYAAPLVGYLPTDAALAEGGYEAADAYRFYAHPGPFARGSEPQVVAAVTRLLRQV